jgi:hypothetical protein
MILNITAYPKGNLRQQVGVYIQLRYEGKSGLQIIDLGFIYILMMA